MFNDGKLIRCHCGRLYRFYSHMIGDQSHCGCREREYYEQLREEEVQAARTGLLKGPPFREMAKACWCLLLSFFLLSSPCQGQSPEQKATIALIVKPPWGGVTYRASGVAIREQGQTFIATTCHEFENATAQNAASWSIKCGVMHDGYRGTWHPARLAAFNHEADVAILDCPEAALEPLPLAEVQVGQPVIQHGYSGTLSQTQRTAYPLSFTQWRQSPAVELNYPARPGDSGAGAFQNGQVVGIIAGSSTINPAATRGESYCVLSRGIKVILSSILNPLQVKPRSSIDCPNCPGGWCPSPPRYYQPPPAPVPPAAPALPPPTTPNPPQVQPPSPPPAPQPPAVVPPPVTPPAPPEKPVDEAARKAILELDDRIKKLAGEIAANKSAVDELRTKPIWLEITDPDGNVTRDKADLSGNLFKLRFNRSKIASGEK